MQVSQMKRAVSQAQRKQRIVECRNSGVPVKEWCSIMGQLCCRGNLFVNSVGYFSIRDRINLSVIH